jgi:hypothetical protein
MTRAGLALFLIVLLASTLGVVVYHTLRYMRYRRAMTRGRRHLKPVQKPFWMN